jgi:uncharacterized membrane protein YphA (DoxX/SURF4 family)
MNVRTIITHETTPLWLLRLGLATVFIYAAISSFIDPSEWIGYLPPILVTYFDSDMLLRVFSVYELGLAVWLVSSIYTRYAALLCAITLLGITASNFTLFAISFRDIGLLLAALALAVMDWRRVK